MTNTNLISYASQLINFCLPSTHTLFRTWPRMYEHMRRSKRSKIYRMVIQIENAADKERNTRREKLQKALDNIEAKYEAARKANNE